MTENSTYHRLLRVSAVVFALVLLFDSGLINETTSKISSDTQQYLANAVGMSASVEPTELNQMTAALTEKQKELEAREAALEEREIDVGLAGGSSSNSDTSTYVLSSILFILLVLILLNYALDYLREKEQATATV